MKTSSAVSSEASFTHPLAQLPYLPELRGKTAGAVPDDAACFALWHKYAMLPNIQAHSRKVAHIATTLAEMAVARGIQVHVAEVRASALLHDIAKTYCLSNGGSHALVGAGWMVDETRNYALAQGVMMHVHWPWPLPQGAGICCLPLLVIYADKRVRHDCCVTLEERYTDLLQRYGHSEQARTAIQAAYEQGLNIERTLEAQLGTKIHEDSFDCGGLVQ